MEVYEITIKPLSGFGTPLKGDTIFGQFCWQIVYDDTLCHKTLDSLLAQYHTSPFIIFSSAYPKIKIGQKDHYALKTPALPTGELFDLPEDKKEKIKKRKEYKSKVWMILKENGQISSFRELEKLTNQELLDKIKVSVAAEAGGRKLAKRDGAKSLVATFNQPHNTINRLTGKTGEGRFAPFAVEQQVFYPDSELALFVGLDESTIDIAQVKKALERIGAFGFGKDGSSGLGRFAVVGEPREIDLAKLGSSSPNACYTLAPCVPEKDTFDEVFFTPFVRFGRHGDTLAKSGNPFKNPVIMADEGGVLRPKDKDNSRVFSKPYLGLAISDISKVEPNSVAQGYTLYIPVSISTKEPKTATPDSGRAG